MERMPEALRRVLERAGAATSVGRLSAETARLIERYQLDVPAAVGETIVADAGAAAAYALYRMPATIAAVSVAGEQARSALPGVAPTRHVDLGGGTGAAVWAARTIWPSITEHRVLEQSAAMIKLGRRLVVDSGETVQVDWDQSGLGELTAARIDALQPDLLTISYVLGELAAPARTAVLAALTAASLVMIIEPGTKAGYRRILQARQTMINSGMRIVAPCPHALACPLAEDDWCHFAARLNRTSVHRMIKNAELSYEDEKFSYLVAARHPDSAPIGGSGARILRHPRFAKGRVELTLCTDDGTVERAVISKRSGDSYRRARKAAWGDVIKTSAPPGAGS